MSRYVATQASPGSDITVVDTSSGEHICICSEENAQLIANALNTAEKMAGIVDRLVDDLTK